MRTNRPAPFGPIFLAAAWCASFGTATAAENIDPSDDDHQYAWGENVGWINAEPSGNAGPGVEVGDFQLTGWMWGENLGWISLSCANTATCAASNFGVGNDGFGALSGYAWSENGGWIDFAPSACAPDPTCGVRIDPVTGYFSGRAWGENAGWISFSDGTPTGSTARTRWCQAPAAPPGSGFTLDAGKSGPDLVLSWTVLADASWYDIASGSLSLLRANLGNFTVATQRCVAGKLVATSHTVTGPAPPLGNGLWFLVRGANCRGHGTYDSGATSQQGGRDLEIATSSADCP